MKREFSSLSENFSPLQRLACISKVTASVCSFVCVCVLLLSCCLGCESGWRVCRGHKETVCVCTRMSVCVCEWMNPRWAWTAAWATKAHTRAQREMAVRRCQPFGPARGSRGPCVFVYFYECAFVCDWDGGWWWRGLTPDLFTHQLASDRSPESSSSQQ